MKFHPLHQQQIIGYAYSIGVGKDSRKGWTESYSINAVVYGVETCFYLFIYYLLMLYSTSAEGL